MSDQPNLKAIHQTYSNIAGILREAMFPGKWAPILHECQSFLDDLLKKLEKDIEANGEPKEDEPSAGGETGAGRVDGSPVPDAGRKNSKRKAVRA